MVLQVLLRTETAVTTEMIATGTGTAATAVMAVTAAMTAMETVTVTVTVTGMAAAETVAARIMDASATVKTTVTMTHDPADDTKSPPCERMLSFPFSAQICRWVSPISQSRVLLSSQG